MPITTWAEAGAFVKRQIPSVLVKRKFNFITIHYMYFIGMSFLFSIILYAIGNMRYIDALFFASGACTQSGLNTLNINDISTGQQFALYLAAMFCNPIVVHGFVVFIRLYWFEKRFKAVVQQAQALRRSKSRSRNNTMMKEDPEHGKLEHGVGGKKIEILRNTGHFTDSGISSDKFAANANVDSVTSSNNTNRHSGSSSDEADPNGTVRHVATDTERELQHYPRTQNPEQHIRFLQRQRHPYDDDTLRIPSPREYDRGRKPEHVSDEDALRIPSPREYDRGERPEYVNEGGNAIAMHIASPMKPPGETDLVFSTSPPRTGNHITIDEPSLPDLHRHREKVSTYPPSAARPHTTHLKTDDEVKSLSKTKSWATTIPSFLRSNTGQTMEPAPYLSWEPTVTRNSFFVNLSEEQREELGGIEYRALKTLAVILIVYFFAIHLFGIVCLVPWILKSQTYGKVVTNQGQGRVWWGIFTSASAFNDLGFTLTADSMIEFGTAVFPMLLMTILIVIGNTGFPCALRFTIWFASICVPAGSGLWEELKFLLDHPRRCFTLLFPRAATWWLFAILIILNGLDLMFFVVLDLHDPVITSMAPGIRFIDGLFQASSTRTAGFAVVNLADLHPAIQVSYLIMMYISVFPIAISMRRTNVYEEKSLGIYASGQDEDADDQEPSYVGAHLRKQLSFDLWYIFLGMFIIAIVEGARIQDPTDIAFNLFSVLFEIVSAYGTVGLSLGYPTIDASFSAEFASFSKLIIIAMQIRGRHRGLPYELDRAILLPSESMHREEQKEAERVVARRRSSIAAQAVESATREAAHFRPETGLASGAHHGESNNRRRANTSKMENSLDGIAEEHTKKVRSGLGTALFKLASAPDKLKGHLGQ